MKKLLLITIMTFITVAGYCQFHLIGTARQMESGCIMLTPNVEYAEGIAYSEEKLDLSQYFEIDFEIYLGDRDSLGADGITFVIHNDPRGFNAYGTFGEGLGYGKFNPFAAGGTYIGPSIAVEFDTYQNVQQNDPWSDHVAFLQNGISWHDDYWNGGDQNLNLEDGRLHGFRFRWNPDSQTITVYLDDYIVYQGQMNLVDKIFNGETKVIWGFTASTGRKHNLQYFCLRKLAYLKEFEDKTPQKYHPGIRKPFSLSALRP